MALAGSLTRNGIDTLYRRHRLRVMLAITLGYGFIYTCRLGLSIVKKPLIDGGIFSIDELGMIGSALLYGYACGKLLNGFAADHFRPRLFFPASILLAAIVNLFMGFSTLLWVSMALWALNGWFQGMAAPSAVISIRNWFTIHERGRCYGIWSASHSIGEGLTFYVIATVVASYGWRYGFITPGVICIAVAAWAYAFLRDEPKTMGLPPVNVWRGETDDPASEEETWKSQKAVFGIAAIWIVAVASALMYVTRYAINSWGVLYLQEIRGMSLVDAGFFMSINTVAGIAGSIAYGFVSDKLFDAKRPPANLIFAIIEVLALLLIFYGPESRWLLALGFALYGAALSGLIAAVGGLFAVDIAPRQATGAAMGLVGVFSYLGAALQETVSAGLISKGVTIVDGVRSYDFDTAILFWIGSSVLSLLLAASLWNTKVRD
ncbi:MAG: MFS transporter [Gammaproteobacteria bacterium]|nr:MFS transporter [Gammaproteobacteria bacterium]MDH4314259.1 MFS transporter [Gammaproteobacteria bacterium]MDH5502168.1 MFS transporter [Gammaproteobacteria bacterium]